MAATLNSETISKITEKEKQITGQDEVVKGGPTAQAQSHVGEAIGSQQLHDITEGEKKITGGERIKGGPTAAAQSILSQANGTSNSANLSETHSGVLDSATISKIHAAEKNITGSDEPAQGGPTAAAQSHANEAINRQTLHDITEGEKKITGRDTAVKGGPTATAQSELAQSRQN